MHAYLEHLSSAGRDVVLLAGERLTLGRHPSNDLVLADDGEVSRAHAVLELVGPAWVVRDLSSRNGTRVNGARIEGDRPLQPGDEVSVGSQRLVFRTSGDSDLTAGTVTAEPPPELTPRERDVLLELFRPMTKPGALAEPASTREIAESLVVSEAAVKQHLARLYDKFGVHSGLDRRRMRLANEALGRNAVSLAEVRRRFGQAPEARS